MTKKPDAPAIRFKGFSDAWEQRKLGELVDRVVRKNTNNESTLPLTISAQYGLVDQITYFNNRVASRDVSNYYLVLNGEFAYNKSTSDGYPFGAVKRLDLYEKGVLSTLYIVFSPKKEQQVDSDFLTVFFDTDRWHKGVAERAAEGARNHGLLNISAEDFFDIDLSVPKDVAEQKQIGAFIRQLDNLITLHQRKFEKLTNVKKSMLEKMFPQNGCSYPEIRFKGFTDAWEQRKLGELVDRVVRKNTNNESTLPLTISAQYGLVDQITYFNNRVASRDVSNYYLVLNGEFAYNKSTSDGYPFGAVKRLDLYEKGVLSTLYIVFSPKKEQQVDSDFLTVFFDTDRWHKGVAERAAEGARNHGLLNISAEDFFDIDLSVPKDVAEQKQIGAFIRQLDNLITLHQRKFEKLTNVKKSMLEKMFPQNGSSYPEIRFKGFTDPWEQRKLSEMCGTFEYGLNAAAKEFDGKNKYIRITDIDDASREFLLSDLSSPDICLDGMSKYLLSSGDIVFARTGASVGKTYIYRENDGIVYFAGFLIRAKVNQDNDAEFVFQSTLSPSYEKYIRITSQRSGQPGVNAQEYGEYDLFAPSKEEQQRIGHFLRGIDNLITLHQRQAIVYAVIRSIRKVILAERQYFAPPMVRKSP